MQPNYTIQCWALKTRDLTNPQEPDDYWSQFLYEKVIAIGWPAIDVNPAGVSRNALADSIIRTHNLPFGMNYSVYRARVIATMIQNFVNIGNGDEILICQGYSPNQKPETLVHLYGFAQVNGSFFLDQNSNWWKFKHKATIRSFRGNGLNVPKSLLEQTLGKASLMQALHKIEIDSFRKLADQLHLKYGI